MREKKIVGYFSVGFALFMLSPLPLMALDKVRVGLSAVSATSGSLWVAEEKGIFKKHGIEPELILIGGGGASLDKGGIDAAVLTMPLFFVAEERGYRLLGDAGDMDIRYLQNSIDSTRSYVRRYRDQAVRFIKANIEGIAYFKKHKKESLEVLQKKLRIQSEQERERRHLESSYQLLAAKYYNPGLYPPPKAVETVLDFLAAEDPKIKGVDPRSFLDDSIVREIEASGFTKALYEN